MGYPYVTILANFAEIKSLYPFVLQVEYGSLGGLACT